MSHLIATTRISRLFQLAARENGDSLVPHAQVQLVKYLWGFRRRQYPGSDVEELSSYLRDLERNRVATLEVRRKFYNTTRLLSFGTAFVNVSIWDNPYLAGFFLGILSRSDKSSPLELKFQRLRWAVTTLQKNRDVYSDRLIYLYLTASRLNYSLSNQELASRLED